MFFGYNTNGFAHHRLSDTISILADLGYQGIGLTVDYHTLNVLDPDWKRTADILRRQLEQQQMNCVIETGARFLLDPKRKHQPTLLSSDTSERQFRWDFLAQCVELGALLNAPVSFWSGATSDDTPPEVCLSRLADACKRLADYAAPRNVRLAFEPEPGMFIDTMTQFRLLHERVAHPQFGLTIDVGHLQCLGEWPISAHLRHWRERLWNIHIEDMKYGVHDHLLFGEGDIDFADIFTALRDIRYVGGVFVELSRHSHNAVAVAQQSITFLRQVSGIR
jgi:sugar phosphate isomerase/epimerase